MKLKTLEIHNIASIEDATIDFGGDILAGQDLFLICGPTGSGKTSILDAICLALFNKTPRMEGSSKKEVINSFADKDSANKVHDTLHLVRKNAVDAYVSLTFETDDHEYRAIWRAFRKGQYRSGKVTSTFAKLSLAEKVGKKLDCEWMLVNDQGIEYTKGVETEIMNVIKMNFDQFCKTTMLAQGDFTKFLGSSSDEKAQILEKLVGSEQYAEVGREINRTANDKKKEIDVLSAELGKSTFLEDTQKAEKREEISALDRQIESIDAAKGRNDKKIKWIEDRKKALDAEAEAKVNFENAEQALLADDVKQKQRTVKLWDETAEVRDALSVKKKCSSDIEKNHATEGRLVEKYRSAMGALGFLMDRRKSLTTENSELKASLDEQKNYAEMFAKADVICSMHSAVVAARESIGENAPLLKLCDEKVKEYESKIAELKKQKTSADAEIESVEEDTKAKEELLKGLGADTIDDEISQLNKRNEAVVDAEHALRAFKDAQKTLLKCRQSVKDAEAELSASETAKKAAEAVDETAAKAANESRLIYDKAYLSLDNHASALRAKIQVGDNCPVCGSLIEHLLDEAELKAALKPLEEKCKADAEAARQAAAAHAQAKAKVEGAGNALRKAREVELEAHEMLGKRSVELGIKCKKLNIECDEGVDDNLSRIKGENADQGQVLSKRKDKIGAIRQTIGANGKKITAIRRERIAPLDRQMTKINDDIAKKNRERGATAGAIESAKASIDKNKQDIALLLNPEWKPADSDRFFEELKDASETYSRNCKMYADNETTLASIARDIEQIESWKNDIDKVFPEWKEGDGTDVKEIRAITNVWSAIRTDALLLAKSIQENENQLSAATSQIDEFKGKNPGVDMAEVVALLELTSSEIVDVRKAIDLLSDARSQAKALYDDAVKRAAEFAESPLAEDETMESLSVRSAELAEESKTCAEKKGSIQKELVTDEENRRLHGEKKKELDRKRAEYAEWETLNKYLGNTDGKNFRNVAQSFILADLLDRANAYLANISTRYTLFCHPGTLTIMMRDAYQGGIERPTNTLSGGESFIISLSLALGLSSMQNVDFEVDTLFIDEGFGTLSPEFLDPVITSLKRLNETCGRRVGIISHVEALKQRIPASIEVTRRAPSTSRITVKLN